MCVCVCVGGGGGGGGGGYIGIAREPGVGVHPRKSTSCTERASR